tara:strand:+ start:108 stop:221 length:114 start_codon:yes stop_codon:yes gene_type:complete
MIMVILSLDISNAIYSLDVFDLIYLFSLPCRARRRKS